MYGCMFLLVAIHLICLIGMLEESWFCLKGLDVCGILMAKLLYVLLFGSLQIIFLRSRNHLGILPCFLFLEVCIWIQRRSLERSSFRSCSMYNMLLVWRVDLNLLYHSFVVKFSIGWRPPVGLL